MESLIISVLLGVFLIGINGVHGDERLLARIFGTTIMLVSLSLSCLLFLS